jgi:hypothetical protein
MLWDSKEGRYLSWFRKTWLPAHLGRADLWNDLCPIEDFKSKFSSCFFPAALRVVPRGAEG